jgi:transcriptional regulator of acetoin/glycerol metabolism
MSRTVETVESSRPSGSAARAPVPGLLLVFSAGAPALGVLPLLREAGGARALEVGRGQVGSVTLRDAAVSRRHARVAYDGVRWRVRDLGSRNGTAVDGVALADDEWVGAAPPRVVRTGESLFVPVVDVGPYVAARVEISGELIVGPRLAGVLEQARRAAAHASTLSIQGESGSGKEIVARAFHAGSAEGPFVAVNCAAIPDNIAERLLFGARRGAYSGAEDADGYLRAAHGGTLFLDEIAELSPPVQAKLLRVLETREVVPLGAARGARVDLRLCSATHKGLRDEVAAGRFRPDLYYRLGVPSVAIPPLRERPEEIAHLCAAEAARLAPPVAVATSLVEECLARSWPGNVRELRVEARTAALAAAAAGAAKVEAAHLSPSAGSSLSGAGADEEEVDEDQRIAAALSREKGNVSAAARALGMHRNQLRRWMAKRR